MVVNTSRDVSGRVGGARLGRAVGACFTVGWWAATLCAQVPISGIQGSGASSPLLGQGVTTSGVVTGLYFSSGTTRAGFWLQAPDHLTDGNPATSEGLFVGTAAAAAGLSIGDLVTLTGTVSETNALTQLTSATVQTRVSSQPIPAPVTITLPFASASAPERFEGMRAVAPQTLTVTDHYSLGSSGTFYLAAGGLLREPTAVVAPGSAASAMQAANDLNLLQVDDGFSGSYPKPTPFLFGATPSEATLRLGDTVSGLTGIFSWLGGNWGFVPLVPPLVVRPAPRPAVPVVGGSLRVAGANLLNYFNGDGAGGAYPTSRGASSATEFARQRAHTVAALAALQADVFALTELENDGFAAGSAIRDLVAGLDAAAGATGTFAYVIVAATGTDLITNALLYRTASVEPVGAAASLATSTFERASIAQTFREKSTGARFTVCVNHFKAKGGTGTGGNADQGDGQGVSNLRRTQQAQAVAAWLAASPTGDTDPDVLIMGDLNAYAREDPLSAFASAGYVELVERLGTGEGYSYSFAGQVGALDHALGSPSLLAQTTGAEIWHNNVAEPRFLDYNVENKNAAQQAINAGATPWRASDHDPLLVGLALTPRVPVIAVPPQALTVVRGTVATFTVAARGEATLHYRWDRAGAPVGLNAATLTLPAAQLAEAGLYSVVVENAYGHATAGPVRLTVLQTYAQWVGDRFPDSTGTDADADGNGRGNLLDYALGGTSAASPVLASAGAGSEGHEYRFTQPTWVMGVSYDVEQSPDLETWVPLSLRPEWSELGDTLQTWRVPVPTPTAGGRVFIRLRVALGAD